MKNCRTCAHWLEGDRCANHMLGPNTMKVGDETWKFPRRGRLCSIERGILDRLVSGSCGPFARFWKQRPQ
jgi:hypothetical protein